VIEVPDQTPISPEREVAPVFVTAANPSTEKLAAAPNPGSDAAIGRAKATNAGPANDKANNRVIEIDRILDLDI
jgi:hypothetical protein